jgi:hypothetical protein
MPTEDQWWDIERIALEEGVGRSRRSLHQIPALGPLPLLHDHPEGDEMSMTEILDSLMTRGPTLWMYAAIYMPSSDPFMNEGPTEFAPL